METSFRFDPPIAFAHRGARANAPENTLEAFVLALKLGASGLESDVWLTADGQAVLDHDGTVRSGLRKKPISSFNRDQLPGHIPALAELYQECGNNFDLSLDVKDSAAVDAVVDAAKAAEDASGTAAVSRLWLCHETRSEETTLHELEQWRARHPTTKLVLSTRKEHMKVGPERCAADLAAAGIDAVNMRHDEWSLGLTALFHRFELSTFGWDAQYRRVIDALLRMEIDGLYSDHVDRLSDAFTDRFGHPPAS